METGASEEPGINGGIFSFKELFNGTVNTVAVPGIDAYIEKVKQHVGQAVVEKHDILSVGYNAYCKDVDGTIFRIHKEDPSASV